MTAFSLFPSFVKLYYHTAYSPHVQIIPTRQWNTGLDEGSFDDWASGTIGADDMVQGFVQDVVPYIVTTTVYDYYEIWNYPDEDSLPEVVRTVAVVDGEGLVDPSGKTTKAVEVTYSFKTSFNNILKIVLLDGVANTQFDKVGVLDAPTYSADIIANIINPTNGWAGRDGGQPMFCSQIAFTLNEKLRRSYRQN